MRDRQQPPAGRGEQGRDRVVLLHDVHAYADREGNRPNTKDTPHPTYSLGTMFTSLFSDNVPGDLVDTSFSADPLIEEPVTSGGDSILWDCDMDGDGDCDEDD